MTSAIHTQHGAISQAIEARIAALSAKDAAGVIESGTPDFVSYSLAPPLRGDAGDAGLQNWFDTWEGSIGYELRDLEITAGDDIAFSHGLIHMTGRKTDGQVADLWFRQTLGLRKQNGAWKIAHDHSSTPFYMDGTFRAAVDLKP